MMFHPVYLCRVHGSAPLVASPCLKRVPWTQGKGRVELWSGVEWTVLPDMGLEVRETREGAFWRHVPPDPCQVEEGTGPYASLDDAARDGADYARFAAGG
jgi:hypothetical protein